MGIVPPAEVAVDAVLAGALIASQFPELAPVIVEPFGQGWDNTAFLVNQAYAFRFPRRAFAVPLMESEIRLLPSLAPRLPLDVPCPLFVGRPGQGYPWPFAGYRRIGGSCLCRARVDEGQRRAMAGPLGRFLQMLHAVPVAEARANGATGDTIGRGNIALRKPKTLALLERATAGGVIEDPSALRSILLAAPEARPRREDTLSHGDLYCRHLLVAEGALCGVIDWGDVHVGDRAVDLAVAWSLFDRAARRDLLVAYGDVDPETLAAARFRAVHHALVVSLYAQEIADGDLQREQRRALRNILAA